MNNQPYTIIYIYVKYKNSIRHTPSSIHREVKNMQLHSKRHHWHVRNLKIKIKQADMCRTDGSSFSTTGWGFCRDSPSSDGRVRLVQHEWMWSSSCEFGETNGCDPLRLGEGGEIGWGAKRGGSKFRQPWAKLAPCVAWNHNVTMT